MGGEPLAGSILSSNPWVWIAAFFTIAIYSFLYKDNVIYKIAENIFIGVAAGYLVIIQHFNIIMPDLVEPLINEGRMLLIIPLILMILMFMRVSSKIGWISRISIAFMVGAYAGLSIPTTIQAMVVEQIRGTLIIDFFAGNWLAVIGAIILFVGTFATLVYFFFSKPHKGVTGGIATLGIWFLMIGFGASFGYTVMARISLLIGRILFLMRDWLMVIG